MLNLHISITADALVCRCSIILKNYSQLSYKLRGMCLNCEKIIEKVCLIYYIKDRDYLRGEWSLPRSYFGGKLWELLVQKNGGKTL